VESLAAVGEGRGKRDEMWEETNEKGRKVMKWKKRKH
jgi:hypothetical protein